MNFYWQDLIANSLTDNNNVTSKPFIPLTQFIDGHYIENTQIFVREKHYPISQLIKNELDTYLSKPLRKYARIFLKKELNPEKILFIDTETTGLNRSQGTFVFMLGIGSIKKDSFILTQYFIEEMNQECILYDILENIFKETELFISYNGKSFDIPLLQSRLILQRKLTNIKEIAHLDLLPIARRLWKTMVDSFSLSCIEYKLLDKIRNCEEDVPGYLIPDLYAQYQQDGNPEKLIPVFYHNEDDISSLLSLFAIIIDIFKDPLKSSEQNWLNCLEFGRLFEQIMEYSIALNLYEKAYLNKAPRADYYLAKLYKKLALSEKAEPLWETMADYDSLIELAILYEKRKCYSNALCYSEKAFAFLEFNDFEKKKIDLSKRINRLKIKLQLIK